VQVTAIGARLVTVRLSEGNSVRLKAILARCPELNAAAGHVSGFAVMMRELRGDLFEDCMRSVEADDVPALHSFLTGIKRDQDAVVAGLTLPWSSGAVEGAVTRIKLLKRIGYGRAKLALLRKRVLHAI
jgi:transposase